MLRWWSRSAAFAVSLRGSELFLTGEAEDAGLAESVILKLLEMIRRGDLVDRTRIRYAIALAREGDVDRIDEDSALRCRHHPPRQADSLQDAGAAGVCAGHPRP